MRRCKDILRETRSRVRIEERSEQFSTDGRGEAGVSAESGFIYYFIIKFILLIC